MNRKRAFWSVVAVIGVVVLCYLLPPVPRAKTHAHRVQGVNTVRFAASAVLTNTNAPAALPSPGQ